MRYYIASCVFTSQFPELSFRICDIVQEHYDLGVVRSRDRSSEQKAVRSLLAKQRGCLFRIVLKNRKRS